MGTSEQNKRYRKANIEKVREISRNWARENVEKTRNTKKRWEKENKNKMRKYHKKFNDKNKQKRWAQKRAFDLISLIGMECQICGLKTTIERHHLNYKCPLQVIFLCRLHHKIEHRKYIDISELKKLDEKKVEK